MILLISLNMFLTVHHLAKVLMMIVFCLTLTTCLPPESQGPTLTCLVAGCFLLLLLVRHQDQVSRMEWLWRERLKGEEEGVEQMQGINKVLLENLLPAHVARHFITIIKVREQTRTV